MRIVPRIRLPRFNQFSRRLKQGRRHLTVWRVAIGIEWLIFGVALLSMFTGSRAAFIDRWGERADLLMLAALLALLVMLHFILKRRIVPMIERYFLPTPYDQRRILFDLGQEVRDAAGIDHLYQSIVTRIAETLEAEQVSIFVHDETTGNYLCRISASRKSAQNAIQANGAAGAVSTDQLALARDAFVVMRLRHLTTPLVIEKADYEAWRRAFSTAAANVRQAREREQEVLRRIDAHLLVQVKTREQLTGILSLGLRRGKHPYSAADKEVLMSIAVQLALVIENARLAERMVAEDRLRRELALAAEVQRGLFPAEPPISSSLELCGFCQPARGVGGDYYDFIRFDNQQIGVAIADVSGKGISAALIMSNVQAALRSQTMAQPQARMQGPLAYLVSMMNRLLCSSTGGATYVTFFYAQFDERTNQLTYVNAGHNPPFLMRGNECLKLAAGGLAIGMFEFSRYEEETVQLQSGDLIVAYTDGVTEALNAAGEELGETRLCEAMAVFADRSAKEAMDGIATRLEQWCSGMAQHDDLTMIVLKVQ